MLSLEQTQHLYLSALAAGVTEEQAKLVAAAGISVQTIRVIK